MILFFSGMVVGAGLFALVLYLGAHFMPPPF